MNKCHEMTIIRVRSVKCSTDFVRLVTTGMSFHTGTDPSNYIIINI